MGHKAYVRLWNSVSASAAAIPSYPSGLPSSIVALHVVLKRQDNGRQLGSREHSSGSILVIRVAQNEDGDRDHHGDGDGDGDGDRKQPRPASVHPG